MKILFVVDSFRGGAGNVIQILAREFKKRGYDCSIFLANGKLVEPKYDLKNIEIIDHRLDDFVVAKNPIDRIKKYKTEYEKIFDAVRPDAIISFLTNNNTLCCMANHRQIPLIISERIDPSKAILKLHWRVLRRLEYGKADKIVVQCSNFSDFCGGQFRNKTVTIANPILDPGIYHTVQERKTITFISMGRLVKQKNFPWMIDCMCEIHERVKNSVLNIYGSGAERDYLQAYIESKNAQDYIHLAGYADEPYHLLADADIYLMTSDYEGFPNALSEAMAVGLPSVSRECHSGIKDLVEDEINGYLIAKDDKNLFVEKCIELTLDCGKRKTMSNSARSVCIQYSVGKIADCWEKLIQQNKAR